MYTPYNPNPIAARVEDCAVRALCFALGSPWEATYISLCLAGLAMGDMPHANNVWGSILRKHGFKRKLVEDSCPDCYTVEDFCKDHPKGLYVMSTANHVLAVKDGCVYDTWDSTQEHPIYYWYTEE